MTAPTARERLRSIAFELRQIDMGEEADALDTLATRLDTEMARASNEAHLAAKRGEDFAATCLSAIYAVLVRVDAPLEPAPSSRSPDDTP